MWRMAAREQFIVNLKCRTCGRAGTATMSQPKSFDKDRGTYETKPEWVPDDFRAKGSDIVCAKCGYTAL
jgi:hypothetical protein